MKKTIFRCILGLIMLTLCSSVFIACSDDGDTEPPATTIAQPQNLKFDYELNKFTWDAVEDAEGYKYSYGHFDTETTDTFAPTLSFMNGSDDFTVQAFVRVNNGKVLSAKTSLAFDAITEVDEINANIRIEEKNGTKCLVWDDFGVSQYYTGYFSGDDEPRTIGIANNAPFYSYRTITTGCTSVRFSTNIDPVYDRAENVDGKPTFYFLGGYLSEAFEYNVSKLDTPTVRLNKTTGELSWDKVEHATDYNLVYYKDGEETAEYYPYRLDLNAPSESVGYSIWVNSCNDDNKAKYGSGAYNFKVNARCLDIFEKGGIPLIYADSDKSEFLSDDYNIQIAPLKLTVTKETDRFSWSLPVEIGNFSVHYYIKTSDKSQQFYADNLNTLTFAEIKKNLDDGINAGNLNHEGALSIVIEIIMRNLVYNELDDMSYGYYEYVSEEIAIERNLL